MGMGTWKEGRKSQQHSERAKEWCVEGNNDGCVESCKWSTVTGAARH